MASKNYEAKTIQTKDGALKFGSIHDDDVKSSFFFKDKKHLSILHLTRLHHERGG